MSRIRALIVDDEPLAREGIVLRLERHADVEIVGAMGSAADAVAAIRQYTPDLVFLDVQMPGMSGFDVLARVGVDSVPAVIFVTAHDQYALRAFRAHALDYLLKPVDDEEFLQALQRARERLATLRDGDTARRLRALLAEVGSRTDVTGYAERIALKNRTGVSFVATKDIEWIEAKGDYVRVHAGPQTAIVREKLRELEQQLDPRHFLRIHRSTIVGLRQIRSVQPRSHGEFVVTTASGTLLRASRTYRDALARALGDVP